MVDGDVVGSDPAYPGEVTEGLEEVSGHKVPECPCQPGVGEEPLTTDTSSCPHTSVCLRMEGVEKGTGDEVGRPDCQKMNILNREKRKCVFVLIDGGWTRKRRATPPMEKPMSWVDMTIIQWSGKI